MKICWVKTIRFIYGILLPSLIFISSLSIIGVTSGCSLNKVNYTPGTLKYKGKIFYSTIRAKYIHRGKKEKAKILLKFNKDGDRLIFLGILNQVMFEIIVRNEKTLLIIRKKKKYWTGSFSDFSKKFWNLEISYIELKRLLFFHTISEALKANQDFNITLSKTKKYLRTVINGKGQILDIKTIPIKSKISKLNLNRELKGYTLIDLHKTEIPNNERN